MNYIARKTILAAIGISTLSIYALTAHAAGPTYTFTNTFDTATVDGSYTTDWPNPLPPETQLPQTSTTPTTIHVPMWEAGDPNKANAIKPEGVFSSTRVIFASSDPIGMNRVGSYNYRK